jgi:type II secretory pathway pseudopilin PulG
MQKVARNKTAAFTLIEIVMAVAVMALVITTSITTLQYGMGAVDTARNMTLAAQIMQSQIEVIRMQNWTQITALQSGSPTANPFVSVGGVTITEGVGTAPTTLDASLTKIADRFVFTRTISDIVVGGVTRPDIKSITFSVAWTGVDRRSHTLNYQTRYARNGLSDYLYVAH